MYVIHTLFISIKLSIHISNKNHFVKYWHRSCINYRNHRQVYIFKMLCNFHKFWYFPKICSYLKSCLRTKLQQINKLSFFPLHASITFEIVNISCSTQKVASFFPQKCDLSQWLKATSIFLLFCVGEIILPVHFSGI
jgi:hypothetical protein